MNKSGQLGVVCACIWMSCIILPAHATTITTYSDRISFDAAVGATTLEDFLPSAHFPITSGILNEFTNEAGISPGDIQSGVTYSTPVGTSNFFNIDAGGGFVGGFLDSLSSTGIQALTIDFDSPESAFGFDTNALMGTNFDITINYVTGHAYVQNFSVTQSSSLEFFGFQSNSSNITSVVIQGNDFNYAIDNFSFSGMSSAPVPAAIWLFGSGLLGLIGVSRRKKD